MLHTGYLYKMGDGPIDYNWNQRYFVLDVENRVLTYFKSETDRSARNTIDLSQVKRSMVKNNFALNDFFIFRV